MKIYALNGIESPHTESVKRNVSLAGGVVLRGIEIYGIVQLLEGSHRMAYAVELGLPVKIILFNDGEVVFHDCDDIESPTTGLPDYATAGELARALIVERGLLMYKVAVYESGDYENIDILKPVNETGDALYTRLNKSSPFFAFPEKVRSIIFGEYGDVVDKKILVCGKKNEADAFKKLGADVVFIDASSIQEIKIAEQNENRFDIIYTSFIHDNVQLNEFFSTYKRLLKIGGMAVTLNDEQVPEFISSAGLNIYGYMKIRETNVTASFAQRNNDYKYVANTAHNFAATT